MSIETLSTEPTLNENINEEFENFDPISAKETIENERKNRQNREAGAKILNLVGFRERNRAIVDSSYKKAQEKARATKQKPVDKSNKYPITKPNFKNGNERHIDSYITRLEEIINPQALTEDKNSRISRKNPNYDREGRLWSLTGSSKDLLIKDEDIPNSYWEEKIRKKIEEGKPPTLSESEKIELAQDLRAKQRESIQNWSNYLAQKDCPFPMWFKLFAWDGVTKMSAVFDREHQRYAKRDKTTVALYPNLNPAILAKAYDAICQINNINGTSEIENPTLDESAKKIIKNYNFNNIYAYFYSIQTATPEVPKNTEDIHGNWLEYLPGDENKLAEAAAGTPWCISSPVVGKSYLTTGKYNNEEAKNKTTHAKFILFHLQNETTNEPYNTACASIRLGTNGKVEEISGIQEDQVLDDSLVPIVEEKVYALPGGRKKYEKAFEDKRELIRLGQKMQNGDELNADELTFIYEIDRPIQKIELYGNDPRISQIKEKYPLKRLVEIGAINKNSIKKVVREIAINSENITTLIDAGLSKHLLKKMVKSGDIFIEDDIISFSDAAGLDIQAIIKSGNFRPYQNIEELSKHNIPHETILQICCGSRSREVRWAIENYDYLSSFGFTATEIAKRMSNSELLSNLDFLDQNSIKYNLNKLVRSNILQERGEDVIKNAEDIMKRNFKINFHLIANILPLETKLDCCDILCNNGEKNAVQKAANIIAKKAIKDPYNGTIITYNLTNLLKNNIKIKNLPEIINNATDTTDILKNLDPLLDRGIDPEIDIEDIPINEKTVGAIVKHPEKFDVKSFLNKITDPYEILYSADTLIENKVPVNMNKIAREVSSSTKIRQIEKFKKHGVEININEEIKHLNSGEAYSLLADNLELLKKHHADIPSLIAKVQSGEDMDYAFKQLTKPLIWRLTHTTQSA